MPTAYPDIVELLVTKLLVAVNPVAVGSRVPKDRPAKHLQVRRVGGTKLAPVRDRPRIDLLARADTEPEANALLDTARAYVNGLARTATLGPMVYLVEETMGPKQDDDPLTGTPMTWMTLSLTIRSNAVVY